MPDDEAEEKRARWTFNLVVFFLVFAFAIDLSYMTSSILPVGIGLSLIAWRVWRTPEITNPITSHMGPRLRRFVQTLAIALVVAPIFLSIGAYATTNPLTEDPIGFPFPITRPIPGCATPGFPIACLVYDPVLVVLNYLFWAGLSFAVLALARWIRIGGISP